MTQSSPCVGATQHCPPPWVPQDPAVLTVIEEGDVSKDFEEMYSHEHTSSQTPIRYVGVLESPVLGLW